MTTPPHSESVGNWAIVNRVKQIVISKHSVKIKYFRNMENEKKVSKRKFFSSFLNDNFSDSDVCNYYCLTLRASAALGMLLCECQKACRKL